MAQLYQYLFLVVAITEIGLVVIGFGTQPMNKH